MIKRNHQGHGINIEWNCCLICERKQKTKIKDEALKTVASNIIELRNLGKLGLEWYAITKILDENWNRVHTTLYESLKTNNVCFHRTCGMNYNKQKLERFTKNVTMRNSTVL